LAKQTTKMFLVTACCW